MQFKQPLTQLTIILTLGLPPARLSPAPGDLYAPIPKADYLTGKFHPAQHPKFITLQSLKIPTKGRKLYLQQETAAALHKLYQAFRHDHPRAPFWVQSATRNWYDQKRIWENKWTGKTKVQGGRLNQTHPNPRARALKILEYSSMPGTSRHHWGTDVDFNVLNNQYHQTGQGRPLYQWLKKNAHKYGFCQPYTPNRKTGYQEERWHWSHRTLSAHFFKDWVQLYGNNPSLFQKSGNFTGSRAGSDLASIYVASINKHCK